MVEVIALKADLSTYTVDVLLRAAFSLTHRMRGNTKERIAELREQRDLIVTEIKRRCDGG